MKFLAISLLILAAVVILLEFFYLYVQIPGTQCKGTICPLIVFQRLIPYWLPWLNTIFWAGSLVMTFQKRYKTSITLSILVILVGMSLASMGKKGAFDYY